MRVASFNSVNVDICMWVDMYRVTTVCPHLVSGLRYTGWAKKSKPDNFCNNFV